MSTLEVNKITPVSGGTTVQVGESGDTINIPAGATIANAGTATGFGVSLANGVDNRVVTASSASALNGEANLTYNGTILGVGGTGDLGNGIHVKIADSGGTVDGSADELVLENSGDTGMTILSGTGNVGSVRFGDSGTNDIGRINYDHNADTMQFNTSGAERVRIDSNGFVGIGDNNPASKLEVTNTSTAKGVIVNQNQLGQIGIEVTCSNVGYEANGYNFNCSSTTTDATFNMYRGGNGNGSGFFAVRDSGNVVNINNSYGASSDERIKQNITDASSQWNDIKALKIRKFKLKSDTTKTHIGVVAQELETANMNGLVEEARPEKTDVAYHSDFGTIVDGTADNGATPIKDGDGNITGYEDVFTEGQKVKSVKYSVLYMKAIKALQESMERIEQLEAKVTALENA